ncbi:MAG TPA: rhodanese-like domain-containing protein [Planctomycetota bacterium]|nr:rhodanese-like domain-containing protein [Planctomycetota bacterium]
MLRRTIEGRDSAPRSARMGLLDRLLGRAGGGRDEGPPKAAFPPLDPERAAQAVARGDVAVLDVRFDGEFSRRRIPGARLLPLAELPARLGELDLGRDLLVVCGRGERSVEACRILAAGGFEKVRWLRGGLAAYPGPFEGGRA